MSRRRPTAFTLTELIIVMALIVLLLSVSIPAFSALMDSSNRSLAETRMRVAIALGREAAMRSDYGDGAVVFFFEPGGRCYAVAYEHVGTFEDLSTGTPIRRDVFAPVPALEPVSLPAGWMARGLAMPGWAGQPNSVSAWYDRDNGQSDRYLSADRNWVFPETAFYDPKLPDQGRKRQTFMVRFRQNTGELAVGDLRDALILAPAPSAAFRNSQPFSKHNFLISASPSSMVRQVLDAERIDSSLSTTQLLGDQASDTVLARSVSQVVLYKERELASALGVSVDRYTGSLYRDQGGVSNPRPEYVMGANVKPDLINRWLEGDTDLDGRWDRDKDRPLARSFVVQRFGGGLREITLAPADQQGRMEQ
ncbi:MAG: hypothetical protein KIS87_02415 [Phycisphaeraceae bacterium]|nr:hypothetical protein [Phycisphaeraceae bacterium]